MYLTENNIVYVPDIKEEMDYEQIIQDLDLQNENICEVLPIQGSRKRIRLHQLTWEEKIQRKKLRNRIAAQTSRDRKKAKMDHLEETVKELKHQNDMLFMQVEELRKKNELLVDANAELQKALAERPYTCTCIKVEGDDRRESSQRPNVVEEQICVKEGISDGFGTDADNLLMGSLEDFASVLPFTEMLADFKEDQFLYDLERLAESVLEEVEQQGTRRDDKSAFAKTSESFQTKCTSNNEMVGEASKMLESSRSEINLESKHHFQHPDISIDMQICFISSEHSYSSSRKIPEKYSPVPNLLNMTPPTITVSESEKISAIENELKRGIEPEEFLCNKECLNIPEFQNYPSPRSDSSSDLGYESLGSPYGSELCKNDSLNDIWSDSFSELFPELM